MMKANRISVPSNSARNALGLIQRQNRSMDRQQVPEEADQDRNAQCHAQQG